LKKKEETEVAQASQSPLPPGMRKGFTSRHPLIQKKNLSINRVGLCARENPPGEGKEQCGWPTRRGAKMSALPPRGLYQEPKGRTPFFVGGNARQKGEREEGETIFASGTIGGRWCPRNLAPLRSKSHRLRHTQDERTHESHRRG